MNNLSMYYVQIKPYTLWNGERVPNFTGLRSPKLVNCAGDICPYQAINGGDPWVDYEGLPEGTNSLQEAMDVAEEVMETYGYKMEYVRVINLMNTDILLRPRA